MCQLWDACPGLPTPGWSIISSSASWGGNLKYILAENHCYKFVDGIFCLLNAFEPGMFCCYNCVTKLLIMEEQQSTNHSRRHGTKREISITFSGYFKKLHHMLWWRRPLWCPVLAKVFLKFWCIYLWGFSALLKWIFFVRLWLLHLLSQFVLQPLFSPALHFFFHPSVLSLCSPLSFISLFVSVFQLFYACWVMHYKAGLLS